MTDSKKVIEILNIIKNDIESNAQYLTDLDAAIGDSDHGINLSRGFNKVSEILPTVEDKDIGTIFKKVGMTLVSTVGGASGPLYGTAFMKAGNVAKGKNEIDMKDFLDILVAAIGGVQLRGKSTQGEKTMLDAMIPCQQAMATAYQANMDTKTIFEIGIGAAEDGVEYTKTIIATKGRASYLQERSIGHQDPGATSFTILMKAIAKAY